MIIYTCHYCSSDDLVGPFEMDGVVGERYYAHGMIWTVCRGCNRSHFRGSGYTIKEGESNA